MMHLRRSSRHNDRVGTGKRILGHQVVPAAGEEALVGAPRPWKPTPIRPDIARQINIQIQTAVSEEEKRILAEMHKIGATPETHRLVYKDHKFVGLEPL